MKTETVRIKDLEGACLDQVRLFAKTFPGGAELTLANCKRAAEARLDLDWAAKNLLTAPALKAYNEATAPALKAYDEARAPARKAYDEARAPAFFHAAKNGGLK